MLRILFFISLLSSSFLSTHSYTQCLEHQKTLLLQLKHELIFDSSISTKLVQWNERDECCKWYGVECDAAGYVISLQLDDESISGGIGDSSSLFRLEYLQKLNLAYDMFNSSVPIPRGIHNLSYLTHLNLSFAGFGGQVPAELLSLRRLVCLDISNYNLKLEYPNLEMVVQNLTGLRELYLDHVNITSSRERRKWSQIIPSYLPNLTALSLSGCSLSGPFATSFSQLHSLSILRLDRNNLNTTVPDFFANFSSLTTLTLISCSLIGYFPSMIFKIPTLQNLDLSANELLCGSLPPFPQIGSLKSIRLSVTNFSGLIPTSISNLKTLVEINFRYCRFTGSIPSTFANLTQLMYVDFSNNLFTGSLSSTLFGGLSNLVYLDLGGNSFTGYIPRSLFGLPSLKTLWLYENQFIGQLEEFPVVNASSIVGLDLSGNRLQGPIPNSFFQLLSLNYLSLSGNLFNGTFQLNKIQSLVNLTRLDLSYNNLSVDIGDNSSSTYGFPQLTWLHLASCNMSDFPHFLKHSDIRDLDLSNNRIVGEIPSWIWGKQLEYLNLSLNHLTDFQKPYHIPVSLSLLDLQSNQLRGELHLPIPPNTYLWFLLLGNNSFNGSIPTSLCSATQLNILDLSVNKLSGSIPSCLLENLVNLRVLDLGRNNISGRILDNFSINCGLEYLNLNNNTLEEKIPKSLERCTMLEFMNVGNNIINDTFHACYHQPGCEFLFCTSTDSMEK